MDLEALHHASKLLMQHFYRGLRSKAQPAELRRAADLLAEARAKYGGKARTLPADQFNVGDELSKLACKTTHPDALALVPTSPWPQIVAAVEERLQDAGDRNEGDGPA